MSDFSVPPPAGPYTWGYPRTGRPWTIGEVPTTVLDQLRANAQNLNELKMRAEPIVREIPWSTDAYVALVRKIVESPRSAMVQISRADLGLLIRGVISTVSQSQILAEGLLTSAATSSQIDRGRRLLFRAKDTMTQLSRVLTAVRPVTGLGVWPAVIGAALLVIAAVLAYQLVASLQANVAAIADAEAACRLDAEAGRPCSGSDYEGYLRRAREEQRNQGSVPNLADLFKNVGSLVFWGGLLTIGALLGYAAWTAEPARRNVQERLRTASEARWYNGPQGR